jgi:hypothetical protein
MTGSIRERRIDAALWALRVGLLGICAVQFVFAIAFVWQWPLAISLWPFPGTTPLTYVLVGAFFAAAGAATLWATATGSDRALAGIGIDYVVSLTPVTVLLIQLTAESDAFIGPAVSCALAALFGLGLLLWSVRTPARDARPLPTPVRWSFVLFVGALVLAGVSLIAGIPNVIPWRITPELSAFIGWLFLGSAAYFAYGLLRPGWTNAAGQLIGFLAYDVALVWPLLSRFATVPPEQYLSLLIYTAVVTYSGLLAAYYLLVHRPTRI